jgi:WD40 repeat protein
VSFHLDGKLPTWPAVAMSGDGSRVAFLLSEDRVEVRDLPAGGLVARWRADVFGSACIALSADGRLLATGSQIGTGGIWALPGPRFLGGPEGNPVTIRALAFSPDNSRLAVGLLDGTVKLLETHTGMELAAFRKQSGDIQTLTFAPDGTELISASTDALCVWRAPDMRDLTDVVDLLAMLRRPVVP